MKNLIPALALLLILSGCRTVKTATTHEHTDSTWVSLKPLDVAVAGGTTPALDLSAITAKWQALGNGQIPAQVREKVFVVQDTSGRAELRYWYNATGELYAECSAKDTILTVMTEQINRLIRDSKTSDKIVYRAPLWMWRAIAVGLVCLLIYIVFAIIRFRLRVKSASGGISQEINRHLQTIISDANSNNSTGPKSD